MTTKTTTGLKPLTDAELTKVVGGASKNPIAKLLKVGGCGCGKKNHY